MEADAVISVSIVFSRQYGAPKRQGYDSQIAYTSGGRPVSKRCFTRSLFIIDVTLKPGPQQQQRRSNVRLCRSTIRRCCHVQFVSTLSKGRNFVRRCCRNRQHCCQKRQQCRSNIRHRRKNNVERIVKLVAFDNVASTLLLVWTGLNTFTAVVSKAKIQQSRSLCFHMTHAIGDSCISFSSPGGDNGAKTDVTDVGFQSLTF